MSTARAWQHSATPKADVIVLGSGLAGLTAALCLAPLRVLLVTKTAELQSGSSLLAQGGLAAAITAEDSAAEHAADTCSAGAGLCDEQTVLKVAEQGEAAVAFLEQHGVVFDRAPDGSLLLGREGAHSRNRILHAGGDAAGKHLTAALAAAAEAAPHITLCTNTMAIDLAYAEGRVAGLWAVTESGACRLFATPAVVLATGGCGALWPATSNPPGATADGLALAARQGAELVDLEFAQFHPTTLLTGSEAEGRLLLLSEALRGAGALLLDEAGRRFMCDEHPLAELAPRDVVARAIWRRRQRGETVRLDLRPALAARGAEGFPQALAACRAAGFEPTCEAVPVTPAMHYHMGGIATDTRGRSSLPGLWACGEVAATGLHGANRLASNSLLEAVVCATWAAQDVQERTQATAATVELAAPMLPPRNSAAACREIQRTMRTAVGQALGVERSADDLQDALTLFQDLQAQLPAPVDSEQSADPQDIRCWLETRNMLLAARLIAQAALAREESRGAHFRRDHPITREAWAKRISVSSPGLRQSDDEEQLYAFG